LKKELIILVLAAAMLATASAQMTDTTVSVKEKITVNASSNSALGIHLVNATGFTLYYFTKDAQAKGTSACYDQCAGIWPPFYTEKIVVPVGLNVSDFSTMTRTDGKSQTTYKGWPLYNYSGDKKSGDALGQGVLGVWFVAKP
jgi:predicted lipoprotein with Yx(FWY)xxD motif